MKSKVIRAATVAAAALALILLAAACGGSSDDSDDVASLTDTSSQSETDGDGTTLGPQDPEEAALAYARCMREHGVDMPDPSANGGITLDVGPGERETVEEAQEACDPILQSAGSRLSEEQQSAMQDAQLAFAKCMREHGIDYPDPQFNEDGSVTQQGGPSLDPEDPEFKEAEEACRPIIEEAAREAGLPEQDGGSLERSQDGS